MNAPTLVELRTAVAALHARNEEASAKQYALMLIAELNLTRQLNARLEEELAQAHSGSAFLNWLKALEFIDHAQIEDVVNDTEWLVFTRDPVRFLKHCTDAQQSAILRELARSQQPKE